MTITDSQIGILESLIIEGEVTLNSTPKGKVNFIEKVKNTIKEFCQNNNESSPNWIDTTIPPVIVGNESLTGQAAKEHYYPNILPHFLNMLRELQSQYYMRKQLEEINKQTSESSKQTDEAKKQTEESVKQTAEAKTANKWSSCAVIISTIAVVVSICALCLSTCTRTIHMDEGQYQELKQFLMKDSI
ncbi:MAG: hypothetical protein IJ816_00685 [Alloprevotella sp.]|nr:hypothetical protein [Alloprevotella sp.]